MSQKTEFLKELKNLLETYDVSICFNLSSCSDTTGLYDERITIDHRIEKNSFMEEEWLSVDGRCIGASDIEITEDENHI